MPLNQHFPLSTANPPQCWFSAHQILHASWSPLGNSFMLLCQLQSVLGFSTKCASTMTEILSCMFWVSAPCHPAIHHNWLENLKLKSKHTTSFAIVTRSALASGGRQYCLTGSIVAEIRLLDTSVIFCKSSIYYLYTILSKTSSSLITTLKTQKRLL